MQVYKFISRLMSHFERPLVLNSQRGFSLAEVVAASAITGVIALGTAGLVAESRSAIKFGEFQSSIDSEHNLNVQKVNNIKLFLTAINIGTPQLNNNCFKGNGNSTDNCNALFGVPAGTPLPMPILDGDPIVGVYPNEPSVYVSITYGVECTTSKCNRITAKVETRPSTHADCPGCNYTAESRGLFGKKRLTTINIPASYLTDKRGLLFSCVDDGIAAELITSIDYSTLKASCTRSYANSTTTPCAGSAPPKAFDTAGVASACQTKASVSCPNGYKQSYPFNSGGNVICN